MNLLNNAWFRQAADKLIRKEMDNLPQEQKAALEKIRVTVVRHPGHIVVDIDAGGDADAEKAKAVLLDSLVAPISQVVTLFGCKANVEQSS